MKLLVREEIEEVGEGVINSAFQTTVGTIAAITRNRVDNLVSEERARSTLCVQCMVHAFPRKYTLISFRGRDNSQGRPRV